MADDFNNNVFVLNRQKLQRILSAYRTARKNNAPSFKVDSQEFLTEYAKYFLMHWCPKFGGKFTEE